MNRRELIAALGGVAALHPLAGAAQQSMQQMKRVGVLMAFPENDPITRASISGFSTALARLGWQEGMNIRIDYRFAAGDPALFNKYAADLVGLSSDVILAITPPAVTAVQRVTQSIPIVFVLVTDPVAKAL